MLRELQDPLPEHAQQQLALRLGAVLEQRLGHEAAELVLHELVRVLQHLRERDVQNGTEDAISII